MNVSVFALKALEYVINTIYETKYRNIKFNKIFFINSSAGELADTVIYRIMEKVGIMELVTDYSANFKRVNQYMKEIAVKVNDWGASYGYTDDEIKKAMAQGINLDTAGGVITREAGLQRLEKVAFSGDTVTNKPGFIAFPGITEATIPADGTGSSKLWNTKTAAQIIRDLNALWKAITVTTDRNEIPNTLLLDEDRYTTISTTLMTEGSPMTILEFFLKNRPEITMVETVPELSTAGAGATHRVMMFDRSNTRVEYNVPVPFQQFAPHRQNQAYNINCRVKIGGINVIRPLSVAYGDGI